MVEKPYIECPFCSGLVKPIKGRQNCPECRAAFVYDQEMQCIFADTKDMRLPIQGTVCTRCGMVQGEKARRCGHCGAALVSTKQ